MRPIHFYCEGPGEVHRGESVGIRCMVMNRSPYDLEAVIVLKGDAFFLNCLTLFGLQNLYRFFSVINCFLK